MRVGESATDAGRDQTWRVRLFFVGSGEIVTIQKMEKSKKNIGGDKRSV